MDDENAARWAIRLERDTLGEREQAELADWLNADERRRGALLRAEAVLAYLDRGRALAELHDGQPPYVPANGYRPTYERRGFLVGGALGAMAVSGLLGYVLTRPPTMEIETMIGEVRRVPLADGSVASLNTNSKVAVAMLERRRQVQIEDGEVWFQVAHDNARPFVVETGDVRVQAIGTAFSVRRREDGADILVTEGVVEVWVVGREGERRRIEAGSKGFVADAKPAIEVVQASGDIDRALAWRNGEIALNGESLEYAAAELNRYNLRKLVIEGNDLGREPLVGYFRTDQPENFGRAVANMVGARVKIDGDTIRLSR